MGKVIIDVQMLGMNFMQAIFREAETLAKEKGLDAEKISKSLAEAPTQEDFMKIIEENFGDELVILF